MSTTAAKADGYVVMTEDSPKGNEMASSKTQPKTDPQQIFFKGEPLALGITQTLCGLFQILFGIILDVFNPFETGFKIYLYLSAVPFWSGALQIFCGSLSMAAARNPRIGLVRAGLVMSIITAVLSAIAIIIYIMHIIISRSGYNYKYNFCIDSEDPEKCRLMDQASHASYAIFFLMLIFCILGFFISISTSAFGCKALCRRDFNEVSVVIYQTTLPQPTQTAISAVPPSIPDVHVILPSVKEFENP